MDQQIMTQKISRFFIWTFLISWLMWLPTVLYAKGVNMAIPLLILGMFSSFVPSVVGLVNMRLTYGKSWFSAYLKPRLSIKFKVYWFGLIPVFFMLLGSVTYMLTQVLDPNFTPQNTPNPTMIPLIFLQILILGGALGEEFGWRGYVYPLMKKIGGPLKATLILGILWSLWHLPLFFMIGTVQSNMPIWQFLLQNTLFAFFYTWLYERTQGNLILMIYLHAIANTVSAVFPYWQSHTGRLIGFVILCIAAIGLYVFDRQVTWRSQRS